MVAILAPGDRILDYVIIELIGSGGFGDVYRAEHTILHRTVAIKVPRDEEFVQALGVEGALQHGLEHPGIVRTVEVHLSHQPPFLALEHIDGPSLRRLLGEGGILDPGRALRLATGMAEAIAHAHAQGVVHGDIKPENVLVSDASSPEERVRLTDFGLGRVLEGVRGSFLISRSLAERASQGGTAAGTLRYIAPEVLEGGSLEPVADVYAFGVVLFEMLTGTAPAGAEAPSQLRPELPGAVDELFAACYTRRERRLRDGAELLPLLARARDAVDEAKRGAEQGDRRASESVAAEPAKREAPESGGAFEPWRERLLNGVRRRLLVINSLAVTEDPGFDLAVTRAPAGSRRHALLSVVDELDADTLAEILRRAEGVWCRRSGIWECNVSFVVAARLVPEPESTLWQLRGFSRGWWQRRRAVLLDLGRGQIHSRELGAALNDSPLRKQMVLAVEEAAAELVREDHESTVRKERPRRFSLFPKLLVGASLAASAVVAMGAALYHLEANGTLSMEHLKRLQGAMKWSRPVQEVAPLTTVPERTDPAGRAKQQTLTEPDEGPSSEKPKKRELPF